MANPSVGRGINQDRKFRQAKLRTQPLVTRRFAAWAIEVSMIATSALVPLSIGNFVQHHLTGEQVPLNPVVATAQKAIATTLALPQSEENKQVPPLTNVLWSVALLTPIALSSWQIYLLAKTGSTLPKRWFGLRVVTSAGKPPGITKILVREGVGTWGLPLTIAYTLWRCTGLFPNPTMLISLAGLMVLAEGMSARFDRQRRSFHDRLAGTYVINANRVYAPISGRLSAENGQPIEWDTSNIYRGRKPANNGANAAIVALPKVKQRNLDLWLWMRQNPRFALVAIASCSATAVLGTLIGTQVYVRTQINSGQIAAYNSEQLLAATKILSANSDASLSEREQAILNLGTVNAPQAMQLLVNLLVQESDNSELSKIVQQALVTSGPRALPYLQRLNQSLAQDPSSSEKLQANQAAIAQIMTIYSGKLRSQDLSWTNLGHTSAPVVGFSLVLDRIDLSGIDLKGANLNGASLQGTRWQNQENGAIANLTDAQLQAANLTDADLSRVTLPGANLLHAILNQANLTGANLKSANLSSTQMVEANLQQAVLAEASLTGANLGAANLAKADLSAARLSRASALGTNLQQANLKASNWQGADLSKADLSRANLNNANLNAARLQSTNLKQAQMQNANLRHADLTQADLREADLTGADLQGAIFAQSNSIQSDQFIETPPTEAKSAVVEGVDFTNVKNLDPKQIAYICTQGGRHPRCP
ncbi:pentapeptide repeat-containing protein [Aliterella atlantica]|uniref:RDD domain-containing protein n=1 Tax=Aliterella atlantica CENA595 TaxID=1618023 RepID=A0A0D8ZR66_9CYAN|nr:pentapeptide repeat-containing protein [Aliterella atlantica]KJH70847.1 hypothetical protein UH38_15745 [Aliterella atlantica CENA595]